MKADKESSKKAKTTNEFDELVEQKMLTSLGKNINQIVEKAEFLLKLNTPRAFKKNQSGDDSNITSLAKSFGATFVR